MTITPEQTNVCVFPPIDPFHVCGNAANLEYRTIRLFYRSENFVCFVLQSGCIPTAVKGVYSYLGIEPNQLTLRLMAKCQAFFFFLVLLTFFSEKTLVFRVTAGFNFSSTSHRTFHSFSWVLIQIPLTNSLENDLNSIYSGFKLIMYK